MAMLGNAFFDDTEVQDDAELCRLCREGDQSAFALLASRYYLLLKKSAAKYSESADDSEDLFQEGLIALHDAAMTYRQDAGAAFYTYAGVCIRNRSIAAGSIDEADGVPSSPESDPLNAVIMSEELRSFYEFLRNRLSSSEGRVLDLYLEGLSYDEIAERLGTTRKSCDNAMQRVRKKLRGLKR